MDWVQWLGLGGALAAVATFWSNRRDAARSDAASVYVQVTLFQSAPAPEDSWVFTRFQIVNDSRFPASSVGVDAWDWGRRRFMWRFLLHRGWWTGHRITGAVYPTITPSHATAEHDFPGPEKSGPAGEVPPIMLRFRDGHGREWVRWPDGKLTRLAPSLFQVQRAWWQTGIAGRRLRRRLLGVQPPPDR
jgi:hypothetical protein